MLAAFWDTETNGLLKEATKMHCLGFLIGTQWWLAHDHPELGPNSGFHDITLSNGSVLKNVRCATMKEGLAELAKADLRIAHNGDDFDERVTRKLHGMKVFPKGRSLDTLLISRLIYPLISKLGPNTHRCPPNMKSRHSLEAWGYRLGEKKDKGFDGGDWQTPSWEMFAYMMTDVVVLVKLFKWLMSRKPSPAAVETEHKFAKIMRRQEAWGFAFDYEGAITLQAEVSEKIAVLEAELIESFGEFWIAGKEKTVGATRQVKLPEFPDVTEPRWGKNGKPLKPYVGPPKATYEAGAKFTPVELVQFKPSSPIHVERMFRQRYNWKPKNFTDKGAVKLDDEVLRQLTYPEADKLADLYSLIKIIGYVSKGKNAWLKTAVEEGNEWRQHGRVNTIGTYTFRCSHSNPNVAQVPTRDPTYGHRCRALFTARRGFKLVGFDGSGMQLRLMAHHMAKYDGGKYADVFARGEDPHIFMADSIGRDLMGGLPGQNDEGRKKGKTIDYALPFGGGELRLGSIVNPYASEAEKKRIGRLVKERLGPTFGQGFEDLKDAIRADVESKGYLVGLDGRKAYTNKAHTGLSTLLQMGEAIVMRTALIIMDEELQRLGFRCGVDEAGRVWADKADYEFAANVHDEAQADVKPGILEKYNELSLWCVSEAGRRLNLQCPLGSDCKVGDTWQQTH